MSDPFRIIPYVVRSAGTDVPPEEVQAAINSLAQQTTIALNSVASDPTGPAGGDLSGTYPNPTVAAVHATSGTMSGVTVNSSPIGQTTPAAGAFTTLTATTPVAPTSGGTGRNALTANAVLIGEGSSQVNFAAPGAAGTLLASNGVAVDPTFQTQASLGIAPLASPAFTGTPTAPTAAAHTNTTQLATTAFVETEFASPPTAGVGSVTPSPGAFTTLSATSTVSGAGFTARFASPGPIGNTAASTGAFTTITASSTITPNSTAGIVGTTTNDNANAGSIGEYVSAGVAQASPVSLTNNTNANVTSISLTAGDWDVEGTTGFVISTGASALLCWVNTASATQPILSNGFGFTQISMASGSLGNSTQPIMRTRISITSTTTVFMSALAQFGAGTVGAWGFMRARRVR